MTAALLDGKSLAQTMQAELAAEVAAFTARTTARPGLAAVLVGDRPDSRSYVNGKRKACEKVGIDSWLYEQPADATQGDLLLSYRPTPGTVCRRSWSWSAAAARTRSTTSPTRFRDAVYE